MTDTSKNTQKNQKNNAPQYPYKEEVSMEMLAKRALTETIREGGTFARKNDEGFKQ